MINAALLKEQLKRFWAIPVLSTLALFFGVLSPLLSAHSDPSGTFRARRLIDIISMDNLGLLFIAMCTALAVACCCMWFFFSRRASTVYYAFPVNKRQLIITNALAGIILCLIPIILMSLMLLIPIRVELSPNMFIVHDGVDYTTINWQINAPESLFPQELQSGDIVNTFPVVFGFFIRMTIAVLFNFALCWLAFSMTGHMVIGLLVAGAIALFPTALAGLLASIGMNYVFGTGLNMRHLINETVMVFSNPIAWGGFLNDHMFSMRDSEMPMSLLYLIYGGTAVLLFVGAFFISLRRKPERTGNSIMFSPVKNVLIFLVSMSGMIIMGAMMWSITGFSSIGMYLGAVLGFIVGYIIAQMIAEKTFLIMHKINYLVHFGGVMLVLYGLMIFVTQVGMRFYTDHIPNRDDIAGVIFDSWWRSPLPGGRYDPEFWPDIFIRDADFIDFTMEIHNSILAEKRHLHRVPWRRHQASDGNYSLGYLHFWGASLRHTITYLLHDGRTITRAYPLTGSFIYRHNIFDINNHPEVIFSRNPIFRHPHLVLRIDLIYYPTIWEENDRDSVWDNVIHAYVTDTAQIAIMMDVLATGMEAQAFANTEAFIAHHSNAEGVSVDTPFSPASLEASFRIDWEADTRRLETTSSWVHLSGDYITPVLDLLREWGKLDIEEPIESANS